MEIEEIQARIYAGPVTFKRPVDTALFFPQMRHPDCFLLGHYDLSDELTAMLQKLPDEFEGESNLFPLRPNCTFRMEVKGGWLLFIVCLRPGDEMSQKERHAYASLTKPGNCEVWVLRGQPPAWVETVLQFKNGKEREISCDNRKLEKAAAKWYGGLKPNQSPVLQPDPGTRRHIRVLPSEPVRHQIDEWRWAVATIFHGQFAPGHYPSDVDGGFIVTGKTGAKLFIIEAKEWGCPLNTATWITWDKFLRPNSGSLVYTQIDPYGDARKCQVYDEDKGDLVDCDNEKLVQVVREVLHKMAGMEKPNKLYEAFVNEGLNLKN